MTDDPERARIEELSDRIRSAGLKPNAVDTVGRSKPVKMSRVGFDFMGSVLGGAVLGVLIDKYFPQLAPWALIAMIFAGFAGGMLNVWRALAASDGERDNG